MSEVLRWISRLNRKTFTTSSSGGVGRPPLELAIAAVLQDFPTTCHGKAVEKKG